MVSAAKLLGSRIRLLRKHLGLTQIQVADAAGLSPLGYQKIERGESFPKIASLESIAKALRVKPTDLVSSESDLNADSRMPFDKIRKMPSRSQSSVSLQLSDEEKRLIELLRSCDKKTIQAITNLIESTLAVKPHAKQARHRA